MDNEFFENLLRSRFLPPPAQGLEALIIASAKPKAPRKDWVKELASLFILPYPATLLPLVLLIGLFLGFGFHERGISMDNSSYIYIEGWL